MEDYAHILDYLPQGYPSEKRFKREPIALGLGEEQFKLFELIPKDGVPLTVGEKVYIGKELDQRAEIMHVKRRVRYTDLTNGAQSELPFVIDSIVNSDEDRFLQFYNEARAITTRFHMFELLPGLGKKTMWALVDARKKSLFKSFEELEERVPQIHNPKKLIINRIMVELSDPQQKYHLFTAK